VKEVIKDKISFRDTLRSLELKAVQRMYSPAQQNFENFQIEEKPDINFQNFDSFPAYSEWKKKIE
jgi:hypothetical protein